MKSSIKRPGNVASAYTAIPQPQHDPEQLKDFTCSSQSPTVSYESHLPQEIDLPEEESFRIFIKSRLPQHKASPSLLQRIRESVQKTPA